MEAPGALEGAVDPSFQSCSRSLGGKALSTAAPSIALSPQPSLTPYALPITGSDHMRGVGLESRIP